MNEQTNPPPSNEQPLERCPNCGCADLFIRKDFPQKLGLMLVAFAAVLFIVFAADRRTFYIGAAVLVAAAVIDGILYLLVPRLTVCYRCRSEFRGRPLNPKHGSFELAVAEKYRRIDR